MRLIPLLLALAAASALAQEHDTRTRFGRTVRARTLEVVGAGLPSLEAHVTSTGVIYGVEPRRASDAAAALGTDCAVIAVANGASLLVVDLDRPELCNFANHTRVAPTAMDVRRVRFLLPPRRRGDSQIEREGHEVLYGLTGKVVRDGFMADGQVQTIALPVDEAVVQVRFGEGSSIVALTADGRIFRSTDGLTEEIGHCSARSPAVSFDDLERMTGLSVGHSVRLHTLAPGARDGIRAVERAEVPRIASPVVSGRALAGFADGRVVLLDARSGTDLDACLVDVATLGTVCAVGLGPAGARLVTRRGVVIDLELTPP